MNHFFPYAKFELHLYRLYLILVFRPFLYELGKKTFISPFSRLQNMQCIKVGSYSHIGRDTLIQPIAKYKDKIFNSFINIGNRVYIGNNCTLSASEEIMIEDGVTIGDHVYIGGGRHGYENPNKSVLDQNLIGGSVHVGKNSWIGYGSFIASAGPLSIGEHVIVAANSVVTKSIPDFTVVAGAPAKPIKFYDRHQSKWMDI